MSDTVSLLSHKGNLAAAATWTSEPTILGQYVSLSVLVSSDQDTSVQIQFSNDLFAGGGGFVTITRSFFAGVNDYETTPVLGKWVRLSVTNVGGAPTTRLSAVVYGAPTNNSLSAKIEKVGGRAPEVSIVDSLPLTGFGELSVADTVPLTQYVFSGVGDAGPTTTATPPTSYYPSITSTHVTGAAGATWSFPAPYTGLPFSGTILLDNGRASAFGSSDTIDRINGAKIRYRAGVSVAARFTAMWKSDIDINGLIGSNALASATIGIADGTGNSYFTIGYCLTNTTVTSGTVRDNAKEWGILYSDNTAGATDFIKIPSGSFNGDKFDGSGDLPAIDTGALNVFEIVVTYLGGASVEFRALNRGTGYWVTLHTIRYANTTTRAFMGEPSMGLLMETRTTSSAAYNAAGSLAVASASFATMSQGSRDVILEELHCADSIVTIGVSTEVVVLALQNPTAIPVAIDSISLACEGNRPVRFRIYEGSTITVGGGYAAVDNWTGVLASPTGSAWTGGRKTATYQLGKSDSIFIPRHSQHFHLPPGGEFLITAFSTQASDTVAAISFHLE